PERTGDIQDGIRNFRHVVQERPVIHVEIVSVDECIHSQYHCEVHEEHPKAAYRPLECRLPSRHPVDDERIDDDDGMQQHKCPSHEVVRGMDGNRQCKGAVCIETEIEYQIMHPALSDDPLDDDEPNDHPADVKRHGIPQIVAGFENIPADRKSTRLNSSHVSISYAVFCLKKKIIYAQHCAILSQIICTSCVFILVCPPLLLPLLSLSPYLVCSLCSMSLRPPSSTLFPYTTLFRSCIQHFLTTPWMMMNQTTTLQM